MVNANVGSGKTTVLIGKILYLHLDRNVPLEKMTVLTFTNKAADEIVERLRKIKPDIAPDQVQGFGTFHSVALRMLKNSLPVEEAGWTKEFTVMDPDEETDLAMKIIQEHGLKVKYKNRLKSGWSRSIRTGWQERRRAGTGMTCTGSIRFWQKRRSGRTRCHLPIFCE